MGNARTERNKARRRSERESAVLEAELRMLLDPLPDGPLVRGRPFKETFMDVWVRMGRKSGVKSGRKSVPSNSVR